MVFLFKEVTGKKIDLLSKQNKQGITILELRRLGVSGQKLPNAATNATKNEKIWGCDRGESERNGHGYGLFLSVLKQ